MKKNFSVIAAVVLSSMMSFACFNNGKAAPETPVASSLTGTLWQLSHAREVAYKPAKGVRKVFIMLGDSSKLTGFSGCNNMTGSYDTTGGKASIKFKAASTQMMCQGEAMKIENALNAALAAATQYHVDGNTLTLMNDYGTMVADFVAEQK